MYYIIFILNIYSDSPDEETISRNCSMVWIRSVHIINPLSLLNLRNYSCTQHIYATGLLNEHMLKVIILPHTLNKTLDHC